MRKIVKENESYYPDRNYKNSAKNGTIKTSRQSLKDREKGLYNQERPKRVFKSDEIGKSYINALISTRWTSKGEGLK